MFCRRTLNQSRFNIFKKIFFERPDHTNIVYFIFVMNYFVEICFHFYFYNKALFRIQKHNAQCQEGQVDFCVTFN